MVKRKGKEQEGMEIVTVEQVGTVFFRWKLVESTFPSWCFEDNHRSVVSISDFSGESNGEGEKMSVKQGWTR